MHAEALISLAGYFVLMMLIGLYAYRKSTDDVSGYMLGGRQLGPAVASLSAGASDMSGWMLMGLPGAIFLTGLSEAWIAVGLMIGAYFNYKLVAPRLRVYTEVAHDAITIPDFLEKRFGDRSRVLRILSAVVIIVFFTLYTSAGIVSGGKLFETSFGLDYRLGLFLTAGVVVAYTMFGGFMAVSLTDFVQGCIMFIALVLVPVVAISQVGGPDAMVEQIALIAPERLQFFPESWSLFAIIGLVSTLSWGLGYFGQPHIIVRFMAVRSLKDVAMMRRIGMSWMAVTVIGAVATGASGLAYASANNITVEDSETIFIILSQILFHPYIAGFLLAAILAAIMSTISSQLLVSSSSLTEDFYKAFLRRNASEKELVLIGRASVLAVSLIAIGLAFDRSSNILTLVSNAWAGFGAAFGPVILFGLFWRRMTRSGAVAGMIVGSLTVLVWIYVLELSGTLYEMVPGFIACTATIWIVSKLTPAPEGEPVQHFEEMLRQLKRQ